VLLNGAMELVPFSLSLYVNVFSIMNPGHEKGNPDRSEISGSHRSEYEDDSLVE
jgi:hypothetical protein